jgi:hypothetical protein
VTTAGRDGIALKRRFSKDAVYDRR